MTTKPTHSEIGASSAYRWVACPGSVKLSRGFKNETSSYAAEGTLAHDISEKCLKEGFEPYEFIGQEFKVKGFPDKIEFTDELAEAAEEYVSYVNSKACHKHKTLFVEESFVVEELHPNAYGRNDACVVDMFDLEIIDLKAGKGKVVEVDDNLQLIYYALGALASRPFIENVTITIVQPRAKHSKGTIRSKTYTVEEIYSFVPKLKEAIEEVYSDNPSFNPGDHCQFCPASGSCKAQTEEAFKKANLIFKDVVAKNEPIELPSPESLSVDEISKILESTPMLDSFLRAVNSHAFNLINSGTEIPNYKTVRKKTRRKFEEDAADILSEYLDEDEIYEKKIKGLGKIEPKLKKLLGKEEAEKVMGKATVTPKGGLTLTRVEDTREEIKQIDVAFKNVKPLT